MKHLKKKRILGRDKDQRRALLKTMLGSLILKEKITTTEAKAKELKKFIDPIINRAKKIASNDAKKDASVIRELLKRIPQVAVKKLSGEFINKFSERDSGYTRVIKLPARKSDDARMAIIEFV